jgi:hypothetical protein
VGSVSGANNPQGVNVNPMFATGQKVRAWATLCSDVSPPSLEHTVQPQPLPLPAPGFDPFFEGGSKLVVNNITNGRASGLRAAQAERVGSSSASK